MKSRREVRIAIIALIGVVLIAGVGWAAARQIRSPAQIAADTAAPSASLISVPVERRGLATEVIVRGTVRYGKPQAIALPASSLKTGSQIVSRIPKADAVLGERSIAMIVSGRPVFVLRGDAPMNRDLGPGDRGQDVRQLEQALRRFGYSPGAVDGQYDGSTAAAVAALYRSRKMEPFGLTESQTDKLNTAASAVAAARANLLQTRLAQRGGTPAELNQAKLDATAVGEQLATARAAIGAARTRVAEARDLGAIAKRGQAQGDATVRRDIATAAIDVTTKQNLLNEAVNAQAEAQRAVDLLPPDATPSEVEAARAALRTASAKVPAARADLVAAEQAYRAAEAVLGQATGRSRDDARKAARDQRLAETDLREAQRTLQTLERKRSLALARVRILQTSASTPLEREAVDAASDELRRASADLSRLAQRSGVQVPADEILFFPTTPVRVDAVTVKRGSAASGDLMTVSNTRLAIDSSLSPQEKNLVRPGMAVKIEEQDLRIDIKGRVNSVASKPGTNPDFDPGRTYFEVTPFNAPAALRNASVRLTVAVQSTEGEVLTVPIGALSIGADGRSRVQVDGGANKTRVVYVTPGLRAQGLVQVTPKAGNSLKPGDLVVVGSGSSSAAAKAPTASTVPITPAGVSTTPSAPSSSAGSAAGTSTAPTGTTPGGASSPTTGAPAATTPTPPGSGLRGP